MDVFKCVAWCQENRWWDNFYDTTTLASSPKLRQRKFGLCLSSRHTLVASCRYTLHTSILWLDEWIGLCVMAHTIGSYIECIRYCQKFFVWLGHETTYAYTHWLNSAICLQKPFLMLHDQNYVVKCLGGLLCYQIAWGKYQRLEKATQRPAKARLKSIAIVYKKCLWFTT